MGEYVQNIEKYATPEGIKPQPYPQPQSQPQSKKLSSNDLNQGSGKQYQGFNTAIFLNDSLFTPKKSKGYELRQPYRSPFNVPPVNHLLIGNSEDKDVNQNFSNSDTIFVNEFTIGEKKSVEQVVKGEKVLDADDEFDIIIDLSRKLTQENTEMSD